MQRAEPELWSVGLELMLGGLRPVERLAQLPEDGTVVVLVKKGGHPTIDRRGTAVVRDGVPVRISEAAAVEIHDSARSSERRYRRAVKAAGLPDRPKRTVAATGHEWEADTVSAYGEPGIHGEAYVACTKVRGRQVWIRAATWTEVTDLGADLG